MARLQRLTFSPLSLDTCLLSVMSHLLPRIIFSTSDEACWEKIKGLSVVRWECECHSYKHASLNAAFQLTSSMFLIQFFMFSKDFSLQMS